VPAAAQPGSPGPPTAIAPATATKAPAAGVGLPVDFVVGLEDVLGIVFWRDQDMTGDVAVRPDGMITLPLIGDIRAAGLRPEALKTVIETAASKFITEPLVSVVVRQINSRKVFITGQVTTPGAYPLIGPRTVMQLIALAGGLTEYADGNAITVMRLENGRPRNFKFRYRDVMRGKFLGQNMLLQPGDTVVVP
jgi:polysaccharide export outer membrane protein